MNMAKALNENSSAFAKLVQEVVDILDRKRGKECMASCLKSYNGLDVEWEKYADYNADTDNVDSEREYRRHLLAAGNGHAVLLLIWPAGSKAPMHGHRGCECWVRLLSGQLTECVERIGIENEVENKKLNCGDVTHINDEIGRHSIYNESFKEAVTLHIYTKFEMSGLEEMRVDKDFREEFKI